MKTTKLTGVRYETVFITSSNTTIEMKYGAAIYGGGKLNPGGSPLFSTGIFEDTAKKPGIFGNIYNIDGKIYGAAYGVATFGDQTTINIGAHAEIWTGALMLGSAVAAAGANSKITIADGARISGPVGVHLGGTGSIATNDGYIQAGYAGMFAGPQGGDAGTMRNGTLINNGLIETLVGMQTRGSNMTLINGAEGDILAFLAGMVAEGRATIVNHGRIRLTLEGQALDRISAIAGDDAKQMVTNDGRIIGDVTLGGGNDRFDTIGGTITGKIYGGEGDDIFSIDSTKTKLIEFEDEGFDTVRSTASYTLGMNIESLILLGTKDVNATGNTGDNVLMGNKGDNVLTGLAGSDIFVFASRGGKDTITDFETGIDMIALGKWNGMDDFADVRSHARNHGDDVWIKLGKDVLIIEDHHKADLVEGDFLFT